MVAAVPNKALASRSFKCSYAANNLFYIAGDGCIREIQVLQPFINMTRDSRKNFDVLSLMLCWRRIITAMRYDILVLPKIHWLL